MKTETEDEREKEFRPASRSPGEDVSIIGLLAAMVLFVWVIPAILILGLFRINRAEEIGLALRELIRAFARKPFSKENDRDE